MSVTTCPRCHGAGLLARGAWLRTCRRCRGRGEVSGPPCHWCRGVGHFDAPTGEVIYCHHCGATGLRRRCPAGRLYVYLTRHGIVPCVEDYTYPDGRKSPLLTLWTAGRIVPAPRVWRLVERHFDGLLALLAADCPPPPPGVRAACCGPVNEGPPRRAIE